MTFYVKVLNDLCRLGWISKIDSILVLAGGTADRDSCLEAGLSNVVISNLDYHAGDKDYRPFSWRRLDAEKIECDDNSFDWAVIHAGLHHLAVPHAGVCEMFRVAKKGVLCFESRDSLLMRLAIQVGLVATHELEPAFLSKGTVGGYRNGPIPNYVYRWTEREFEKLIDSYAPDYQHAFFYRYSYSVPTERFAMARNPLLRVFGNGLAIAAGFAERVLPKQGNAFAFAVCKNKSLQPWLEQIDGGIRFRTSYLESKYDRGKYWRNTDESK
jgi:hypothetical protein